MSACRAHEVRSPDILRLRRAVLAFHFSTNRNTRKMALMATLRHQMKKIIFLTLFFSSSVYGWECPRTNNSYDLDVHWKLATGVFWGKVTSGTYNKRENYENDIDFTVDIYDTFKGDKRDNIELSTSHASLFRGIELGGNYIFFVYGNNKVDFCSILVDVQHHIETLERLNEFYSRDDTGTLDVIKYIQKKSAAKP